MIRVHASEELRLYGGPGGQVATIPWMGCRRRIKPPIHAGETVDLIRIEGGELFVLGDRNVGDVMYRYLLRVLSLSGQLDEGVELYLSAPYASSSFNRSSINRLSGS
ncbi:hypothetical protein SABR111722_20710 [Saccharibacillus brassicae]